MKKEKLEYIEKSGIIFEQLGMTRMAGRVFSLLIVSEKTALSFDEIRDKLKASKGSISGTTKQLINAGLIERVSLPGDRKTYFRPTRMKVGAILKARVQMFARFSEMLYEGRALKDKEDDISEWLTEIATFYGWVGDRIEELIDTWEDEKEEIIKQNGENHGKANS